MNANDIETTLRARAVFNDSIERIDADTRRRLRELRLQALNGKPQTARWIWSAGAVLAAALALVVFLPRMPRAPAARVPETTAVVAKRATTPVTARPAQTTAANEIAASDPIEVVDPDMLTDLDFYGWLAKQPGTDASGG
jgi:hypothetical protein